MSVWRRVRWYWWAAAGLVVVAVVVAIVVGLPRGRRLPPPRARVYRDFSVCLLTGPKGLADPAAQPVWAGMQDASLTTLVRVSYLAATGPETVANDLPYAAALVQRHCDVIVAVGSVEVAVAGQEAQHYLDIRFVLVGGGVSNSNVSVVVAGSAAEVRAAVSRSIRSAAG